MIYHGPWYGLCTQFFHEVFFSVQTEDIMKDAFLKLMIYAGSALMAYNIYGYICFSRDVRKHGNWDQEQRLFNLPILLLIMFFIGYLIVGFFGIPDRNGGERKDRRGNDGGV